jgi:hypothetical protein
MADRYLGKVVRVLDDYSIVVNRGADSGFELGNQFLVVGLGDEIIDPDTNENLGRLEIVKGKVEVAHAQEKMATLKSCRYSRAIEKKEIKKVSSSGKGGLVSIFGAQDTVTESITPGEPILLKLESACVGDVLVKV